MNIEKLAGLGQLGLVLGQTGLLWSGEELHQRASYGKLLDFINQGFA